MNKKRTILDYFIDLPALDSDDLRKRKLFTLLCLPGILVLGGYGLYHLSMGWPVGGILDSAAAIVLAASVLLVRNHKNALLIYRVNAFILFIVILFWTIDGGASGEKLLWMLIYPLAVLFVLGGKEGMAWSLALFCVICFLFFWDHNIGMPPYPSGLKVRFVVVYLLASLLTYGYEYSRKRSQDNYMREQANLREEKRKLAQASQTVKAANKAILKSEALLKHAQSIAQLGNWEYDYATGRMWCSEEVFAIFGHNGNSPYVELSELGQIIPGFDELQDRASLFLKEDRDLDLEFEAVRKSDEKAISLHVRAELTRDDQGHASRLAGVIQDITARKEVDREKKALQEKLSRSQKMEALGLLAGGVAHDLNNVMLGIVSYPDYLLSKMQPNDPYHRPLKNICEAGQKAAAIVEDLLTLARRGVTSTQVLDLNTVVKEYFDSPEFRKLQSHHSDVVFRQNMGEDLLLVKGSPLHLKKTIMNLVSNGAEAISGSGRVEVTTRNRHMDKGIRGYSDVSPGDYIQLTVEDNGSGIDEKDMAHIFEPFYTKKVMGRSGTGLGMAVVWGTVQDHSGHIDVRSQPGQGTVIDVYLPVTSEQPLDETAVHPRENYMGNGERILIVDDIKEQRDIAGQMLSDLGYRVATADGGLAAVEHVRKYPVDLLVLDMIMDPGIDGLETYERILRINPGQKAVIVSGFSETDRVRTAQKLGAGGYLKKPYVLEALGMAVRKELDR